MALQTIRLGSFAGVKQGSCAGGIHHCRGSRGDDQCRPGRSLCRYELRQRQCRHRGSHPRNVTSEK